MPLFHGFIFKTTFPIFFHFLALTKKVFFSLFLKLGKFYVFGHENHSKQIHEVELSEMDRLDRLFLTFWKKKWFLTFLTQHFFSKK